MRDLIATVCFTSAIILFSATGVMSTELQTLPWEKYFREPSATLTPFTAPTDYEKVEEESEGPGWRYFRYLNDNSGKFIIYNHGYTAVVHPYRHFTKKRNET